MKIQSILLAIVLSVVFGSSSGTAKDVTADPKNGYDEITFFQSVGTKRKVARVRKNDKWGVIDETGKIITPTIYDRIDYFERINVTDTYVAKVMQNGKWGFMDSTGKIIVPPEYDTVFSFQMRSFSGRRVYISNVSRDGKWGFIDARGNIIIPLEYEDAKEATGEPYNIVRVKNKGGWISIDAQTPTNTYDEISEFKAVGMKRTVARVRQKDKWGYIDVTGKIIIPIMYDFADYFVFTRHDGYRARVRMGNKYGYVNTSGKVVIPIMYDNADAFFTNSYGQALARVQLGERSFFIDTAGNEDKPFVPPVPCAILSMTGFWEDETWKKVKRVKCNTGYGFAMEKEGPRRIQIRSFREANGLDTGELDQIIIPAVYQEADNFTTLTVNGKKINLAWVRLNGKYGFINEKGAAVIPILYDSLDHFKAMGPAGSQTYIARVQLKGKYGYINEKGEAIIPFLYENAYSFYYEKDIVVKDSAAVQRDGKWGFIDYRGIETIPIIYDRIDSFQRIEIEGRETFVAMVMRNGKRGFMDNTGKILIPIEYEMAFPFQTLTVSGSRSAISRVRRDGKWGFIDATGKIIIPLKYEDADEFNRRGKYNIARVKSRGAWIYIDDSDTQIDHTADFRNNPEPAIPGGTDRKTIRGSQADSVVSVGTGKNRTTATKVDRNGMWGYVDAAGKVLVPFLYEEAGGFVSGWNQKPQMIKDARTAPCLYPEHVKIKRNGRWGYADLCGNEVLPPMYDELPDHLRGKFNRVKAGGKYGYIDASGNEIIPCKYDEAPENMTVSTGSGTLQRMKRGGKFGYLNESGEETIPAVLDYAPRYFSREEDKIWVSLKGKWGYIDKTGRETGGFEYREDPCTFKKRSGDNYLFADEAAVRSKPEVSSDIIAKLPAGGKIGVVSQTEKDATFGDETDRWYRVEHQGKTGFAWGGDMADSVFTVPVDGKERLLLIRNRTNGTDLCYNPKFEIKMLLDGKVLSEYSGHPFDKVTVRVKSLEYTAMEGFSAPLNLLRVRLEYTGYRDKDNGSGTGIVYFYIDDGKLSKVLDLVEDAAGVEEFKSVKFSTELVLPDNRERVDEISLRVSASMGFFSKELFNEITYQWDWNERTFKEMR